VLRIKERNVSAVDEISSGGGERKIGPSLS
jgi:hypothetical protein